MKKSTQWVLFALVAGLAAPFACHALDTPTGLQVVPDVPDAGCGERLLGGFGQMDEYDGGPFNAGVWKAFRFRAAAGGDATCVQVFIKGLLGDRTDDEVAVAVYEDEGGRVGALKAWGYLPHYDWSAVGSWAYHAFPLDRAAAGRGLVSGSHYWLTVQTSGGESVLLERGEEHVPGCIAPRRGVVTDVVSAPPPGPAFDFSLNDGCYGWSVW